MMSGDAVRYCRIEFHCQINQRTISLHQADCGTLTRIMNLKKDLENVFGLPPDQQEWYIREIQLHNEQNLQYYGIKDNSGNRNPFKIFVKNR
ncbi:hypothetical protein Bpfe_002529 [Biomphalaria pfeifferi]|uniref:Ubiquitin-like domain-containing protein n=1 Tax=Biomphalaria pfeifferi TaxID=112525 RepID=A0AAD8C8Y1_BIOPF|nr:hypothetical protein Bpfe_002529 [Biomphalaria pfeifferi]